MEFGLVEESSLVRRKSLLLHVTDGRVRVWRQPNTAYAERNIVETVPFGGSSVMVWGCVPYDCKLDLNTLRGNLNGQIYRQIILEANVVPHFDKHPLNTRPVFMDDKTIPHRALVADYLRDESITTLPWPARSPDLNPIEHIRDIIGRRVRERTPPVQTLNELEQTLHQEWQRLTQVQIRRLVGSMRRRLAAVIRVNGSYTNY
jgi:transposase